MPKGVNLFMIHRQMSYVQPEMNTVIVRNTLCIHNCFIFFICLLFMQRIYTLQCKFEKKNKAEKTKMNGNKHTKRPIAVRSLRMHFLHLWCWKVK